MKLWGGRFTKETNQLVHNFNASLSFDQKFYHEDIQGSIAHVTMLADQGILSHEDKDSIIQGLEGIRKDLDEGKLEFTAEHEDIHSFVEAHLIERIGDAGKRLHTGRSRNDQVALDMKLYTRHEIEEMNDLLKGLLESILRIMKENLHTIMPGFTHLQKAQPITLAHHMGAYFEMFKRDRSRLSDTLERMNYCPLGSGALAGTTYPLDREETAKLLGFTGPTLNSMDSVSDRDYLIEFLNDMSIIMMHLSRFCEEIILWSNPAFGFVKLPDAYATGSSIMPQKKNPDVAEIMRGKVGRVYGDLTAMLTILKGLPLTYNRDLQEDKEPFLDADHTLSTSLELMAGMMKALRFDEVRMARALTAGFLNATELADYLVTKGIPFREAHHITGSAVALAEGKNLSLEALPLDALQGLCDRIGPDVFDVLEYRAAVARRNAPGGTGPLSVARQLEKMKAWLHETK